MRRILSRGLFAALTMMAFTPLHAQTYPDRPIRVVIPYGAGQGSEVMCRIFLEELKSVVTSPIVIDDKPGAGTNIGSGLVARAKPDGYTLLCTGNGTHVANPLLYSDLGFDPDKDLMPISAIAAGTFAVSVNNKWKGKSLKEIMDIAKSAPTPLRVGVASASAQVLYGEIQDAAKVTLTRVPYASGNEGLFTDLMRGDTDIVIEALPSSMGPITGGLVTALAVTTPQRLAALPNVPTLIEGGLNVSMVGWNALFAPKGTPPEIIDILNKDTHQALALPEAAARLATIATVPMPTTPDQLGQMNLTERAKWAPIVKALDLKAN